MKFGKELAFQTVQEWQEAYMDYKHLKKLLKNMLKFRQHHASPSPVGGCGFLTRKSTLYRSFSGLTGGDRCLITSEDEVILVHPVVQPPESSENDHDVFYQTIFLKPAEDGGENEIRFFQILDKEFNKVLRFYKEKVEAVTQHAVELSKQMDTLIALRIEVHQQAVEPSNPEPEGNEPVDGGHDEDPAMNVVQERGIIDQEPSLGRVKIKMEGKCPLRKLRTIVKSTKKSRLTFRIEELRRAEEKLRRAFIEYHQQLALLKRYRLLNILAFTKILKKYDKITSRSASSNYLQMMDKSDLGSLDEVNKLIGRVEATFIKHFSNGNRRKGVKLLKPRNKMEKHRTTFVLGTELGFREIFLLASALSVLTLVAVLSNLDMEMDPRTRRFQTLTELVPAGLVMVLLLITFCPLNILYCSSRFFLIRCAWRCLLAPLYKVTFSDFFLADQLTSQVQAFRSLQFYFCYYGRGDFKRRSNRCLESRVYEIFYIVVAVIPFWSRAVQCLRRMFEDKDLIQGLNSLKYFSTVAALVIRTIYDFRRGTFWKIMAASSSGVTTIFNAYWDIVMDWGFLQKKARNPWLRDKLSVSNKAIYFVAIIGNILLRLAWMQSVLDFNEAPFLHRTVVIALVACLEILRRGIWNFFRLENEHFDIIEKNRAFRLPFHCEDDKVL
ncbi:hypothetical protein F511_22001 [Dorcoceras hygrometricum]|uniref:Uncharacterized protein n=1 Tax=Dorcoceras hygrometricum TaxID=472368 RepID=A0A2Z7CA27_9LAMI|nr:hypothetical protein F511_22001 [Dorcoceras hygrometricum]